jgi:hypothetical protein
VANTREAVAESLEPRNFQNQPRKHIQIMSQIHTYTHTHMHKHAYTHTYTEIYLARGRHGIKTGLACKSSNFE